MSLHCTGKCVHFCCLTFSVILVHMSFALCKEGDVNPWPWFSCSHSFSTRPSVLYLRWCNLLNFFKVCGPNLITFVLRKLKLSCDADGMKLERNCMLAYCCPSSTLSAYLMPSQGIYSGHLKRNKRVNKDHVHTKNTAGG